MTETYLICSFVANVLGPNAQPEHLDWTMAEVKDQLRARDLRGGLIQEHERRDITVALLAAFRDEFGGDL